MPSGCPNLLVSSSICWASSRVGARMMEYGPCKRNPSIEGLVQEPITAQISRGNRFKNLPHLPNIKNNVCTVQWNMWKYVLWDMQMSKNHKYVHQHWLMMTWGIYKINNFNITKTNINKLQNKITKFTLGYTSCCDMIHKRKVKSLSIKTQLWHCNWKDLSYFLFIYQIHHVKTVSFWKLPRESSMDLQRGSIFK